MRKLLICLVSLCALAVSAQVTTNPAIVEKGYTGQITITFDPTAGNGGMASATQCYAHTGLITASSKDDTDWKNTVGSWRGSTQPKLTKVGNNWQLVIDNMYSFYGVSTSTDIKKLAL